MPVKSSERTSANDTMAELLILAQSAPHHCRRSEKRFPFFRSVLIQIDHRSYSGFTREISASGIGLLHAVKLPLTEVQVTIAGRPQQLRIRIERCESIGDGWHISGGTLVTEET